MGRPVIGDVEHAMKEAVAGAVAGTDWAPPDGAILIECVVIMGWYYPDGSYGSSHITCGPPWSGHGLAQRCVQDMEATYARYRSRQVDDDE